MVGRIVEIANDYRSLSLYRGFLLIKESKGERVELGRVPIDDIDALIANAHGLSYSNNLLVALAEQGAPFVLCGANHNPVGVLWPFGGNYETSRRINAQTDAKRPVKKRLWASIVRSKLEQQGCVLEAIGESDRFIHNLIRKIRSGDPENIEAQAARRYWTLLFGSEFRRNRQAEDFNGLLNYGYTVLRASVARAVIAAGLHPAIGLHHSNASNPMLLVDDLIEPFRPLIDLGVYQLVREGEAQVNADTKRFLVRLLYQDMLTESGVTPLSVCAQKLAVSLAQVFLGEREKLELPLPSEPFAM